MAQRLPGAKSRPPTASTSAKAASGPTTATRRRGFIQANAEQACYQMAQGVFRACLLDWLDKVHGVETAVWQKIEELSADDADFADFWAVMDTVELMPAERPFVHGQQSAHQTSGSVRPPPPEAHPRLRQPRRIRHRRQRLHRPRLRRGQPFPPRRPPRRHHLLPRYERPVGGSGWRVASGG
jgi:hypothetical protein